MKIEFKDVSFSYEHDTEVIKDLSFVINDGEMTSIIGPNGSGKSTIAKLIMGILQPDSGHIYIDDVELNEDSISDIRKKMGIIFQNPDNQFVGVTVKDDIAFGLENKKVPRNEMIEKINMYSSLVRMNEFLDCNPDELSGGQKQRVAIAGVLAMETESIIFDEATSMLDPVGVKEINETMKMLKKQASKTIISITHNIEEILYSNRVLVIKNGQIVASGTPKEILANYELLQSSGLETLDSVKLIQKLDPIKHKDIIEELWKLTFNM